MGNCNNCCHKPYVSDTYSQYSTALQSAFKARPLMINASFGLFEHSYKLGRIVETNALGEVRVCSRREDQQECHVKLIKKDLFEEGE